MTSILRVNSIKTTGDKPILNSTGSILQIVSSVNTAYANSTSNSFVDINPTLDAFSKTLKTRSSDIRFTDYDHKFQILISISIFLLVLEFLIPNPSKP